MDYEEFLAEIYTPLKSIEAITQVIYIKCNEDWSVFSKLGREHGEEIMAFNHAISACAEKLINLRNTEVKYIQSQLFLSNP